MAILLALKAPEWKRDVLLHFQGVITSPDGSRRGGGAKRQDDGRETDLPTTSLGSEAPDESHPLRLKVPYKFLF
jgi:hypothetical protein